MPNLDSRLPARTLRGAVRLGATLGFACLAVLGASGPLVATTVYYLPQNYPEVCGYDISRGVPVCQEGVTNRARFFCRSGLTGLDLAREALGLPACPAESERVQIPGIEYVFLVDDRTLSAALTRRLGDAVRDLGAGPMVVPSRTGPSARVQGIFVGERFYRERSPNRTAWLTRIASLLDLEVDVEELDVPYHSDYATFRRTVEDALCPIMLCRSDGRARMRELIDRVEASLRRIHGESSAGTVPLRGVLYRQPDRDDRIDRLGFTLGETVDFDDDEERVPPAERPDPEPVIQDTGEGMVRGAGTPPEPATGEEGARRGMLHMAYLEGYGVTMTWLTGPARLNDQLLPIYRPRHPQGCGAPELMERNRAGCEAALSRWRDMPIGQRRMLRIPENRARLRQDLNERYCREFEPFCRGCSCERPF